MPGSWVPFWSPQVRNRSPCLRPSQKAEQGRAERGHPSSLSEAWLQTALASSLGNGETAGCQEQGSCPGPACGLWHSIPQSFPLPQPLRCLLFPCSLLAPTPSHSVLMPSHSIVPSGPPQPLIPSWPPSTSSPQGLPLPGQPARQQRCSPTGAAEETRQEAPRSPQQSSQQQLGRMTPKAIPGWDRGHGRLQAPVSQGSPLLQPLPTHCAASTKAPAEPPKAKGLLAIFPVTLHTWAAC